MLEPKDIEHKFYVAGIGNVLSVDNHGEFEQLVAIAVHGGAGHDHLRGYFGADRMFGRAGDDRLDGERGDDVIYGGAGNDTMIGGTGADRFVFSVGGAQAGDHDVITDYNAAEGDVLAIPGGATSVAGDAKDGHGWSITLTDGHVIDLPGVRDTNHDGHIVDQIIFG